MKISVAQQKKLDAGVFLVRGNGSKQPKSALTRRTGEREVCIVSLWVIS